MAAYRYHAFRTVAHAAFGAILTVCIAGAQDANVDQLSQRAYDSLDTNPEQAAILYGQVLAIRPNWAEAWLYRGASLFQLGRYAAARDSFRRGVALEPAKGTPLAFLGMTEYELGDYRQAITDIQQGEAIGLADKPGFAAQVRYRGALSCLNLGDFGQALEQLRPLAVNDIKSPEIVVALGIVVLHLPYFPQTIPAENRSLVELAGHAAWAFLAGHAAESEPLFRELTARFGQTSGVHYLNGVFLIDRDNHAAESEFRKEIEVTPTDVLARVQLAQLLGKGGDMQGAVRLSKEALALQPSDPLCQVSVGRALLDAGRVDEAIAALERGERLAPDAPRTHFYLMRAYSRKGKIADAQREKAAWERLHSKPESVELLIKPDP